MVLDIPSDDIGAIKFHETAWEFREQGVPVILTNNRGGLFGTVGAGYKFEQWRGCAR